MTRTAEHELAAISAAAADFESLATRLRKAIAFRNTDTRDGYLTRMLASCSEEANADLNDLFTRGIDSHIDTLLEIARHRAEWLLNKLDTLPELSELEHADIDRRAEAD